MGAIAVKTAMERWCYVAPLLLLPQTEDDYNALVEALDTVLDAGGADETHPSLLWLIAWVNWFPNTKRLICRQFLPPALMRCAS